MIWNFWKLVFVAISRFTTVLVREVAGRVIEISVQFGWGGGVSGYTGLPYLFL